MKNLLTFILCFIQTILVQSQAREWLIPLPGDPGLGPNSWSFETRDHLFWTKHETNYSYPKLFPWNGTSWENPIQTDSVWMITQLDEQNDTLVTVCITYDMNQVVKIYDGKNWKYLAGSKDKLKGISSQYFGFSEVKFYNGDLYFMFYQDPSQGDLVKYSFKDSSFTTLNTLQVTYGQDWYRDYPDNKISFYLDKGRLYVAGMYDSVDHIPCEGFGYTDGNSFTSIRLFKDNKVHNFAGIKKLDDTKYAVERISNSGNNFSDTRMFIMENDSIISDITFNLYSIKGGRNLAHMTTEYYDVFKMNGRICFFDVYDKQQFLELDLSAGKWKFIDYSAWDGNAFYFKNKYYLFSSETYLPYKYSVGKGCFVVDSAFSTSGTAYVDLNNDCKFTSADSSLNHHWVFIKTDSYKNGIMTDQKGYYEIPLYFDTFQLLPGNNSLVVSNCQPNPFILDTAKNYTINLPYIFKSPYNTLADATVNIHSGIIRRGQEFKVRMHLINLGQPGISATPMLKYSKKLTFKSAGINPASHIDSTLTFPFITIDYFNPEFIDILFYLHPDSLIVNDSVVFLATISSASSEVNKNNNIIRYKDVVRGPYDPNYIIANPENEVTYSPEKIIYTIHFQNLGSDTAFNVRVADTIPESLDPSRIRVLEHSGDRLSTSMDGQTLNFRFSDIKLTPKSTDENASQGFVVFEIAVKDPLKTGDQISNSASIYFDYENGIRTNSALVKRIATASIHKNQLTNAISVFPNPAKDILRLDPGNGVSIANIKCMNIAGETVTLRTFGSFIYDITELPQGVYFLEIRTNIGSVSKSFIKQ